MNLAEQPARIYIYGLVDPNRPNIIRYVGKANNIELRLKSHIRDMYRRNYPLYYWMRKLAKENVVPKIIVLKITDANNWQADEIFEIKKHSNLLNIASGGDEPFCSRELRAKNGANNAKMRDKKLWLLKLNMGQSLKFLKENNRIEGYNKVIAKLKLAAKLNHKLFGCYLSLNEI